MKTDELLNGVKTIAVIGCSSNPYRTSYHIARYILDSGLKMIPVNPNETEVLGQKCYSSIHDLPQGTCIDLIDIFRNKRHAEDTVSEIAKWSLKTGQKPVVWTQLDVSTVPAKQLAEESGLSYVENRCFMVEHQRAGF